MDSILIYPGKTVGLEWNKFNSKHYRKLQRNAVPEKEVWILAETAYV